MATTCWRLLELEFRGPSMNLALEEAMLDAMKEDPDLPNTVRLWRNGRAVVLGRFQEASFEADIMECRRRRVVIARRCSGGGAVYHDGKNLNWSLFLRMDELGLKGEALTEAFGLGGRAIIGGLSLMGLQAEFWPPSSICVDGRKVSGMAMCVRGGNLLCHGTLLVGTDLEVMGRVLAAGAGPEPARSGHTRSRRAEVTTIERALRAPIKVGKAKVALKMGIEEALKVRLKRGPLTEMEEGLLLKLYRERYSKDGWSLSIPPA